MVMKNKELICALKVLINSQYVSNMYVNNEQVVIVRTDPYNSVA